jgi:four helix bundle protein
MSTYRELIAWQKADKLAYQVYLITKKFPKDEIYGITSQIRRAALSVPTNIVEGYSRKGTKELLRFIYISLGSLAETEYLLFFAQRLGYLNDSQYQNLEKLRGETGKLLFNLSKKLDPSF